MLASKSGLPAPAVRRTCAALALCAACGPSNPPEPTFTGGAVCAECHTPEADAWAGSHHDLAMDAATDSTVLGDFDDDRFVSARGDTTVFLRDGDSYRVRTRGPDGEPVEYAVPYVFGFDPLQQYLIAFPNGRFQSFNIAWDSRPEAEGGQRWFDLYADDPPAPGEALHWAGRDQVWNYQCAECHSTDLQRNYDAATDSYSTTWSEIDVSCEACHGPGSEHVRQAEALEPSDDGAILSLHVSETSDWQFPPGETVALRDGGTDVSPQVEACARCHSRRGAIASEYQHGRPALETHRVALLDEGLYHADGQIEEEVYVYGSFLQSRMYRAGVTCTDCHDPHTARAIAPGNALCARCHLASAYDTPEHHFHEMGSSGAECVECHMPSTTYMVVDPRRDHSLQVPRPSAAAAIGAPDACTRCHSDRTQEWAANEIAGRYPPDAPAGHVARTMYAVRQGDPRAAADLATIVTDTAESDIVRGSAASFLGRLPSPDTDRALRAALRDAAPLVRLGALGSLAGPVIETHWRFAYPLLDDSVRAVRLEAGRRLAAVPPGVPDPEQTAAIEAGVAEFVTAQLVNAERPEAHLNIAAVRAARGSAPEALEALETARSLDPSFLPVYVNLADLYRAVGDEARSAAALRQGLEMAPDDPALMHALGLAEIRAGRTGAAVDLLRRAADSEPDNPRYAYVYAIGLNSSGQTETAVSTLEAALRRSPYDRDILFGLATISRDAGRTDEALRYARRIAALWPSDPASSQLVTEISEIRR
ncbi:MAG: tetratricopeptide repeat protein [Gemmatimonadota bacterium]|nr:tetratricopeptide repeat protein [Gemmatimonadota bacterium]